MKPEIHPDIVEAEVTCICGNSFKTLSTKPEIKVDICASCHPFYTGQRKLVDSAGRIERFRSKYRKFDIDV
jgi:large subunit ribosomal protein L31